LIVAATGQCSSAAEQALAELCRTYWYPIYAFIRRSGYSPADAEDLTQDFFLRFLENGRLASADRAKGRFRSFLLTAVKNFLADHADREKAEKRGGNKKLVPIDLEQAEAEYGRDFAYTDTPERLFEREWASTLVTRIADDLRVAFSREGRSDLFDQLRGFLPGAGNRASYADIAAQMGTSEGAVKVAVHRLRRRYRELFQAQIAVLVSDPQMIDDEIQYVLGFLRA
jgi:RNA polymerase sigma factor (sigma-70 family)